MTWVKLDEGFADHPKLVAAGGDAGWLWVCGLAYCARHLTDGFLPDSVLDRLTDRKRPRDLATRLVKVGLWERVEGGFRYHDYSDWQPTGDEVRRLRADRREAGKRGASRRWGQRDALPSNGKADGKPMASAIALASPLPSLGHMARPWQTDAPSPSPDLLPAVVDPPSPSLRSGSPPAGGLTLEPSPRAGAKKAKREKKQETEAPDSTDADAFAAFCARWKLDARDSEVAHFVDYYRKKGESWVDWAAAWRNWRRNAERIAQQAPATGTRLVRAEAEHPNRNVIAPLPKPGGGHAA